MRAIVTDKYGPPDVLKLEEVEKPTAGEGEVLVKVGAASIHAGDLFMLAGKPRMVRVAGGGFLRPKERVVGINLAGTVEEVGEGATRLKPGDEVYGEIFGAGSGGCAEYARAKEERLALKPSNLTFEQAAAVPTSCLTALHGLRDTGKVQAGQKVLINGASGGVGHFAVQVAKALGAEVTGVCSTKNVEMVQSIGADHVIDYTQEDFTEGGPRYDLILDNVGNHPLGKTRRALTPDGKHIPNSGSAGMGYVIAAAFQSMFMKQQSGPYLSTSKLEDMVTLTEMIEAGKVTPVIDRTFPLAETADAFRHLATGHARGKVVIASVPAEV